LSGPRHIDSKGRRQPFEFKDKVSGVSSNQSTTDVLINNRPIIFNEDNKSKIGNFLKALKRPYRSFMNLCDIPENGNINSFLISLDAYFESKNPLMSYEEICQYVLAGPSG